jgi:hypothetical protein
VCDQVGQEPYVQTWKGKVSLALWFEGNGKTFKSPEQFFDLEIIRSKLIKEHVIPPELVKEDAARNGFRFLGRHADVVTPDQQRWPFLVFEKARGKGVH